MKDSIKEWLIVISIIVVMELIFWFIAGAIAPSMVSIDRAKYQAYLISPYGFRHYDFLLMHSKGEYAHQVYMYILFNLGILSLWWKYTD